MEKKGSIQVKGVLILLVFIIVILVSRYFMGKSKSGSQYLKMADKYYYIYLYFQLFKFIGFIIFMGLIILIVGYYNSKKDKKD